MAYHPAPNEDLPEVVPAREWRPPQRYRSPGEYSSSYGEDPHYQAQSYANEQSYPEAYDPIQPYAQEESYPEAYEPIQPYQQAPYKQQPPQDQQKAYDQPKTYDRVQVTASKEPRMSLGPNFPRDVTARALPNYRPVPLRWFFLGTIILVLLGYIALTEYAVRTLPHETGRGEIADFADLERQLDASPSGLASETTVGPPRLDIGREMLICFRLSQRRLQR